MHILCAQPVFTVIYLNIGITILILSLNLIFAKEIRRSEIVFSLMDTILPPEDGQTNRSKHVIQDIENILHYYEACCSEHKKFNLFFMLCSFHSSQEQVAASLP